MQSGTAAFISFTTKITKDTKVSDERESPVSSFVIEFLSFVLFVSFVVDASSP